MVGVAWGDEEGLQGADPHPEEDCAPHHGRQGRGRHGQDRLRQDCCLPHPHVREAQGIVGHINKTKNNFIFHCKASMIFFVTLNNFQARSAKSGARALILSPTRELALQSVRFCKVNPTFLPEERKYFHLQREKYLCSSN